MGRPTGFGQRPPQQHLDLGVDTAQVVARPSGKGVMDGRIQPEQYCVPLRCRPLVGRSVGH